MIGAELNFLSEKLSKERAQYDSTTPDPAVIANIHENSFYLQVLMNELYDQRQAVSKRLFM
jgi:hypothetical protein